MTFTLNTFKKEINKTILKRGRAYFRDDHITELEEVEQGSWSAKIQGTDEYDVHIMQDDLQVLSCRCNCLYDGGLICKHIAAVLYAIEDSFPEYFDKKPRKSRQPTKKRKTRHDSVMDVLNDQSKDKLVELLGEIAGGDRQIANIILARFSDESPDKKVYSRMIKDILRSVQDRGFIDYHGSNRAGDDIHKLIEQADSDVKQGQLAKATVIYQAVVETVVPAISHADDSNGLLGDCIEAGLHGLRTVSENLSKPEQGRLFDYCVSEAFESRYKDWDWGWALAQIAADRVTGSEERQRVFDLLDKMAARSKRSNEQSVWSSNFDAERAEVIKLSVVERLDDPDQIHGFLVDRIQMDHFREKLIILYIEQAELDKAKTLCHEWLAEQTSGHRGYRTTFHEYLLRIAQIEEDQLTIQNLSQQLLIDTGKLQYYTIYKTTVTDTEWGMALRELITVAEQGSHHHNLVPQLLVKEEMWDELLKLMQSGNRYKIEPYRQYLEPRFPEAVGNIYERHLKTLLVEKVNRKGYQEACRYLRRIYKLGQVEFVQKIVQELRGQYPNRRALMDELNKLKFV
jgi:uncharacterized Zn finger protein